VVSNPGTFVLGGTVFGVSATDVLFQLNAEECARVPPGRSDGRSDKLTRCAAHLLDQRSYYPLFPADSPAATPLELGQLWRVGMAVAPDVLITPSRLRPLAKAVDGTLVVNPGTLSKMNSGGTYARITIAPPSAQAAEAAAAGSEFAPLHVPQRARVEIVRI
jgi:DNA polymerase alpha subunit B